jgi:hypothetical protein
VQRVQQRLKTVFLAFLVHWWAAESSAQKLSGPKNSKQVSGKPLTSYSGNRLSEGRGTGKQPMTPTTHHRRTDCMATTWFLEIGRGGKQFVCYECTGCHIHIRFGEDVQMPIVFCCGRMKTRGKRKRSELLRRYVKTSYSVPK